MVELKYKVANPFVEVIDFFPKLDLGNGVALEPDEIIQFSGQMVYKNVEALRESIEQARRGEMDFKKSRKSLANTVGRAHASMASMAGGVFSIEGNSSKMCDSAFTGASFSNSHMPSGRRTDVKSEEEEIIVPESIYLAGGNALEIYFQASRNNIFANKDLREKGVAKQEAAKILQYGITGGGSILLSVETIVDFVKFQMNQPLPTECKKIISQLEQIVRHNGATTLLEARKRADRICYPNTSIFRDEENEATELVEKLYEHGGEPLLVHAHVPESKALERRITEYVRLIEKSHESEQSFRDSKEKIYQMARAIAGDFPSFSISVAEFVPWRVWGEDKRHRTVAQVVEPIYHGIGRAESFLFQSKARELTPDFIRQFFSVPESVANEPENLALWTDQIEESSTVYRKLIEAGIDKSDSLYVYPRGVKLALVKTYNLYNSIIGGFVPLRMCSTAEPEMVGLTHKEAKLFKNVLPAYMYPLLNPKCYQVGCSEEGFAKCRAAERFMSWYDNEAHERLNSERQNAIMEAIEALDKHASQSL